MPGNYSHITRADGLVLTASVYNTDHQNHITNMTPVGVDDYSVSLAQMRTTIDPGEVGTEALPTDLAGEIARLRYAIQEIRGTVQWYVSQLAKVGAMQGPLDVSASVPSQEYPDATSTQKSFFWPVPHDYVAGSNLIVHIYGESTATGNLVIQMSTQVARPGVARIGIEATGDVGIAIVANEIEDISRTIVGTGITYGDIVRVDLTRIGASGGDTVAASYFLNGAFMAYTGYAGRG